MAKSDLFAIETSNGVIGAARPRASDLEAVDTVAERKRNHDAAGRFTPRNNAAEAKTAKRAVTRSLRQAVQDAAGAALTPEEARDVAPDALALYAAAKRSVGCSASVVLARLLRNAVNDVLTDRLTAKALAAGIGTEEGGRLLELAHKCETRAERNLIAAIAAAKALGTRKPQVNPTHAAILAAGESSPDEEGTP